MSDSVSLPLPVPTPETQGFWDGCRRHQLLIQRCLKCRTFRHIPRPTCHQCGSEEHEWSPASGRGTIYSYTITYQPVHPALRDKVPWTVVVVELEEGVRMVSNLVDCAPEEVQVGMPVEVLFDDVNEQIALPKFRPV